MREPYREQGIESPIQLTYTEAQRDGFRRGELQRVWRQKYPAIFDDHDLRIALTQPQYHFCEWFTAICIYLRTGFRALVEKYEFHRTHERKGRIARAMLPEDIWEWDRTAQLPDLLCVSPGEDDYFFCEVKGPGDRIRQVQTELFDKLELATERKILVAELGVGTSDSLGMLEESGQSG